MKTVFSVVLLCLVTSMGLAQAVPCVDGMAGIYPCNRVDLMAFMPNSTIGGGSGNDIWGWTDPVTGHEYALMGKTNGTAFVDITVPDAPVYVGHLPTQTSNSSWRDLKVFADHVFVVSEAPGHGMQVFDLNRLRDVTNPPVSFTVDAHYSEFGSAHNVVINEETGFAYGVGADCNGGLHMVDISNPLNPVFAGCFSADGYTHDAQCVIYHGPDTNYQGREICFNYNANSLTIVDVEDKNNPIMISRNLYPGTGYTHQGWNTEDHHYLLMDDETDETGQGHNTRTYLWDLTDLAEPGFMGYYEHHTPASDHNLYVLGDRAYLANYRAGLRILDISDIPSGILPEEAYFDVEPGSNDAGFSGSWSVYPYFESGIVVVSGIGSGLFILKPILCAEPLAPTGLNASPAGDNRIDLDWADAPLAGASYDVYRSIGICADPRNRTLIAQNLTVSEFSDTTASGNVSYTYEVTVFEETRNCESAPATCVMAQTTGDCTAEPLFDGLVAVENPATQACQLMLAWAEAEALCGVDLTYNVYRDQDAGFEPSPANLVASGVADNNYIDSNVLSHERYYYIVRAVHNDNGQIDHNTVRVSGRATGPIMDGLWQTGGEDSDDIILATSPNDGWSLSSARSKSGSKSYYSGNNNGYCAALTTEELELSDGFSSSLSFSTWHDVENSWDGGVVEISTDAGSSWTILPMDQNYPMTFRTSSDACGYNEDDPCFSGHSVTWQDYSADLSAYNGVGPILIRWQYSTDGSVNPEGWYVDDITITHSGVSQSCSDCPPFNSTLGLWPQTDVLEMISAINCLN